MQNIKDRILFEDNHLIVINKLPKELVQSDITQDLTLADKVKDYLKVTYNKKGNVYLGIPHRLDRPTSGIVIFAKTDKALSRLCNAFRENEVKKKYWAVVDNSPLKPEGTLVHYLTRDSKKNKSFASLVKKKNSKEAKLSYKLLGASKSFYLLEIDLHTGRHHQIRAQLATQNIHIKGDLKYGFPRSNKDGGICLHAREVSFIHPVKKERITLVAQPPKDIVWDFFVNAVKA
ncbi:MAG: RNA pseudouridine synthase [Sphaerochaetaceae bacterium]|nr:RNA pseudouridine synthase [Sphaerochaetaceae bacterium]MDC7237164.1 RNA pseudouridine synthase [Sphaerochaetaceae bacterium]